MDKDYPLLTALADSDAEAVAAALRAGANANARYSGIPMLSQAVRTGNLSIVDLLLGAGAEVNVCDRMGMSPLSAAATGGWREIVRRLISAGADVNADCGDGPALWIAVVRRENGVLEDLLRAGANPNAFNPDGFSPLMLAAGNENPEAIPPLIRAGADVSLRDRNGVTAYLHAAMANDPVAAGLLLRAGADPDDRDNSGNSAAKIAADCGHPWPPVDVLMRNSR